MGVGALPMQDPRRAAEEVRRIAGLGLRAGFARPNAYNDRHLHHPAYTPVWEALCATGLPIAAPDYAMVPGPAANARIRKRYAQRTVEAGAA